MRKGFLRNSTIEFKLHKLSAFDTLKFEATVTSVRLNRSKTRDTEDRMPITTHPVPSSSRFSTLSVSRVRTHRRRSVHPNALPRRPRFSSSVQSSLFPLSRRALSLSPFLSLRVSPPLASRAGSTAPIQSEARSPPATLQWERRRFRGWASVSTGCHVSVDGNKCVCRSACPCSRPTSSRP